MKIIKLAYRNELRSALLKKLPNEIALSLCSDIESEIDKMDVPYSFENLTGAVGIALGEGAVISKAILDSTPQNILFVLFHELAHFYQYMKYGYDFALSVYLADENEIDEKCDFLMNIEKTADKFGLMKARHYMNKYNLPESGLTMTGYSNVSKSYVKQYLKFVKDKIKHIPKDKIDIDQINNIIYAIIKR